MYCPRLLNDWPGDSGFSEAVFLALFVFGYPSDLKMQSYDAAFPLRIDVYVMSQKNCITYPFTIESSVDLEKYQRDFESYTIGNSIG